MYILLLSHRPQVLGAYATGVSAQVMNYIPFGYRCNEQFVADSVGHSYAAVDLQVTVPGFDL